MDSKPINDDFVDSGAGEVLDVGDHTVAVDHGLHRALKQRHLQMIALGGVVGYVLLIENASSSLESILG